MADVKNQISVVIITSNEEANIARCLEAALKISDDIILVDSESRDKTIEIAKSMGARCFIRTWEGYGKTKNYGASQSKYEWVLSIDADEVADPHMINALCNIDLNKNCIYGFRRLNYIGETAIRHGDWNPDYKFRLYHKEVTKWSKRKVHESLLIEKWHSTAILPGRLDHYSYASLDELEVKLDQYAKLGAREMHAAGDYPGWFSSLKPLYKFFRSYYLKGGFRDGKLGRQIAKQNADAQRKKFQYLKQLQHNYTLEK